MHFGNRTDLNIDQIEYKLPIIPNNTLETLSNSSNQDFNFYIGVPSWQNKQWRGNLYPPKADMRKALNHAAQAFHYLEFNGTAYNLPKAHVLDNWINQIENTDIKIFPKVPQTITHFRRLNNIDNQLNVFLSFCAYLGNHLEGVLLQLPDNFTTDKFSTLLAFIKTWPKDVSLYLELRHASWFSNQTIITEVFEMFKEYHINTVITDTNLRRDVLHFSLPTPNIYIRYNSNDYHPSDLDRMDSWFSIIKELKDKGLKNAYFCIHNSDLKKTHLLYDYMNQKII